MLTFKWASIVLILVLLTACGDPFISERTYESSTKKAERIIAKDAAYKAVDQVCSNIPVPDNSTFVGKARLFNSVGIIHYYRTDKDLGKVETYFRDYFISTSWEPMKMDLISRVIGFKKENIEIKIQLGGISQYASFSLGCKYSAAVEKQ